MSSSTLSLRSAPARLAPRLIAVGPRGVCSTELGENGELVVGRSREADLTVDDPTISRRHVALSLQDGALFVRDLDSANGTKIGSRAIDAAWARLGPHDVIEIGATSLIADLHRGSGPSEPSSRPTPRWADVEALARRVARSSVGVLLQGETGVGKTSMARAIHRASPQGRGPLVTVECATPTEPRLAEALLEARQHRDGGTILLEDVTALDAVEQSRLLAAFSTSAATTSDEPSVRILATTTDPLSVDPDHGGLCPELYYRVAAVVLELPPLRERPNDVPALAQQMARSAARELGRMPMEVTAGAAAFLRRQPWPGNLHELRGVMVRAAATCEGGRIRVTDLWAWGDQPDPEEAERENILAALERFAGNQTKAARSLGISRTTFVARLDRFNIPRPRKRGQR